MKTTIVLNAEIDRKPTWKNKYGTLKAWCPFCKINHYHSNDFKEKIINKGKPLTHRAAHCPPKSPYYLHGYLLKLTDGAEAFNRQHHFQWKSNENRG